MAPAAVPATSSTTMPATSHLSLLRPGRAPFEADSSGVVATGAGGGGSAAAGGGADGSTVGGW